MGEFLFDYGLFTAKVITVIAIILLGLGVLIVLLSSRERDRETIEIEKINDKFDTMKEALEAEILSKDELKAARKERKKKEKEEAKEAKEAKKRAKAKEKQTTREASKHESHESHEQHEQTGTKHASKAHKSLAKIKTESKKSHPGESKEEQTEEAKQRIFVLKFNGDLHASEVDNLREAITAILTVAKPSDEVLALIDSPGGLVHSYGLAASQLQRIRQRNIKLVASVDLVAASGGYLMACVADTIIAAPFAIVGSIGVLAQIPNFHRLLDKHNIDIEQHTAGEYKTTLTLLGKNTDKARTKFREELEDTHTLFKQFVVEHRPQLDIDKLATGEHWYGKQALALNLIDDIITSDDYLLNRNEKYDIYEVNYLFNETISDKISSLFHGMTSKAFNRLWRFASNMLYK